MINILSYIYNFSIMGNFFSGQSSNQEVQDVGTGTQIYRKLHKAAFNEESKGENMANSIKHKNVVNALKEQQDFREKKNAEEKAKKDAKDAKEKAKNSCLTDPKYRLPTPKKNVPDPKISVNGKTTNLRTLTFWMSEANIDDIIFDICYEWAGNKSVIEETNIGSDGYISNPLTNVLHTYDRPERKEKITKVIKYLIAAGADINIQKGQLLFAVIREKDVQLVEHIVKAGADVNIENKDKETPLYAAIKRNNFDIVKKLVESGADVNKAYGEGTGKNPLDLARYNKVDDTVTQNNIIQFLRDKGAKATTMFNGGSKKRKTHKRKSNKNQRKNRRTKKST